MKISLDTDIESALIARGRQRALIEGRGPKVSEFLLNSHRFGGASTLNALILSQGPVNYWRNGETSGTAMVDQVAANGTLQGGPTLGNTALYPGAGALTSMGGNFSSTIYGFSTAVPSSLTAMTIIGIVRPTNVTGIHPIGVLRDDGSSSRKFQWRSNGAALEFVKITGAVETVSQASMLAINTTYLLGFEVNSVGAYTMYRNGVAVKSGNVAAADYGGGAGSPWQIGYSAGAAASMAGTTCENAVFNKVLGPTVHGALFAATGL